MASTTQPTRSSTRIRECKEAAVKAAAAAAAGTVTIDTTTKNARKGKSNPKRNSGRSKNTKRAAIKKTSRVPTKKTNAAHHRFFMEPEQLSTILEQHQSDGNQQMWVGGKFYAVEPGEKVPNGSLELEIKVPSGFKFLVFPDLLRLVEGEEMEEMEECEDDDEDEGEEEGEELYE
jgi:hypothetical protein